MLDGDDLPAVPGESFTLGALWADLCRLAGEELPPLVRLLIGDEAADDVAA